MSEVRDKRIYKKKVFPSMSKDRRNIVAGAKANDYQEVSLALVENPACINDVDPVTKMTALHWAGANGNYNISELLFSQIDVPVNPWLKDVWGRASGDLALTSGNQKVIDLFHKNVSVPDNLEQESSFDTFEP